MHDTLRPSKLKVTKNDYTPIAREGKLSAQRGYPTDSSERPFSCQILRRMSTLLRVDEESLASKVRCAGDIYSTAS